MRVPIRIERSIALPVAAARVRPLFEDLEGTIRRFPKLRRLTRLADMQYLWEMKTMGSSVARVAVDIAYAAHYAVDADRGVLSWTPLPRHGNATIGGAFQLSGSDAQTRLSFRVDGELHDVPVPMMYRLLATPFIQGKFTHLVDSFLERTAQALQAGEISTGGRRGG